MNELIILKAALKKLFDEALQTSDPPTPAQLYRLIDLGCEAFGAALALVISNFQHPAP